MRWVFGLVALLVAAAIVLTALIATALIAAISPGRASG